MTAPADTGPRAMPAPSTSTRDPTQMVHWAMITARARRVRAASRSRRAVDTGSSARQPVSISARSCRLNPYARAETRHVKTPRRATL